MIEKLGGNDPCPCGSGRRFPPMLPVHRPLRRQPRPLLRPRPLTRTVTWRPAPAGRSRPQPDGAPGGPAQHPFRHGV
ncbi:SEC-C metal-binding domain-containing protein [Acrocarpospora macrocephala]|uniref:SEC-C metal-binding domain-containing protein n=1 Tax=Acrocarpospora macrocephala TaxID=150177 RepID=UPI001C3FA9BA